MPKMNHPSLRVDVSLDNVEVFFVNPVGQRKWSQSTFGLTVTISDAFFELVDTLEERLNILWFDNNNDCFIQFEVVISNIVVKKTFWLSLDRHVYIPWLANLCKQSYNLSQSQRSVVKCLVTQDHMVQFYDTSPLNQEQEALFLTPEQRVQVLKDYALKGQSDILDGIKNMSIVSLAQLLQDGWTNAANQILIELKSGNMSSGSRNVLEEALSVFNSIEIEEADVGTVVEQTRRYMQTDVYTDEVRNTLQYYTESGYIDMNNGSFNPSVERKVDVLQTFITGNNGPRIDIDAAFVWRSINGDDFVPSKPPFLNAIPGQVFSEGNRFTSTSYGMPVEDDFLGNTCCLMKIYLPKGFPCIAADPTYDMEREIILPLDVELKFIIQVTTHLNGRYISTYIYQALPYNSQEYGFDPSILKRLKSAGIEHTNDYTTIISKDIWVQILANDKTLSVIDIMYMCSVNKRFRDLCQRGLIWEKIFIRQFGVKHFQNIQKIQEKDQWFEQLNLQYARKMFITLMAERVRTIQDMGDEITYWYIDIDTPQQNRVALYHSLDESIYTESNHFLMLTIHYKSRSSDPIFESLLQFISVTLGMHEYRTTEGRPSGPHSRYFTTITWTLRQNERNNGNFSYALEHKIIFFGLHLGLESGNPDHLAGDIPIPSYNIRFFGLYSGLYTHNLDQLVKDRLIQSNTGSFLYRVGVDTARVVPKCDECLSKPAIGKCSAVCSTSAVYCSKQCQTQHWHRVHSNEH